MRYRIIIPTFLLNFHIFNIFKVTIINLQNFR